MIAVKLMGGLGNQMFQYATARRLALHLDVDLVLDTSFLDSDQPGCTMRSYELCHLSINATLATTQSIAKKHYLSSGGLRSAIAQLKDLFGLKLSPPRVCVEDGFGFYPEVLSVGDDCYINGYWQTEKYFLDIRENLLEEFQPCRPLEGLNKQIAEHIASVESVSVHVRRGDYASVPKTSAFHGLCSLDYYRRAFFMIEEKVDEPHYFVFSDDIAWARENLNLKKTTVYVDHNYGRGHEDLRLMAKCQHHVIANSSFSWWGAWLSAHENQIVIAPANWFKNSEVDTSDLIPDSWCKI